MRPLRARHALTKRTPMANDIRDITIIGGGPTGLFGAFYARMRGNTFFETLPWYGQELEDTQRVMGENFYSYGIPPNRKTLETLFRYSYEQGIAARELTVDELFEPSTLELLES